MNIHIEEQEQIAIINQPIKQIVMSLVSLQSEGGSDRFCIIFPCHSRWISTLWLTQLVDLTKDAEKTNLKGPLTN
jgi:hypothetical protein